MKTIRKKSTCVCIIVHFWVFLSKFRKFSLLHLPVRYRYGTNKLIHGTLHHFNNICTIIILFFENTEIPVPYRTSLQKSWCTWSKAWQIWWKRRKFHLSPTAMLCDMGAIFIKKLNLTKIFYLWNYQDTVPIYYIKVIFVRKKNIISFVSS